MTESTDRFLLHISYHEVKTKEPNLTMEPMVMAWPTFEHALIDMMKQPLDSFHPTTAEKQGMANYIQEAKIMDMSNGNIMVTAMRLNTSEAIVNGMAVFLAIEPGQPMKTIFEIMGSPLDEKALGVTSLLPLLAMDPQGDFLYPTQSFRRLSAACFSSFLHLSNAMDPYQQMTSFVGLKLSEASVVEGGFQYQTVNVRHYYEATHDALSKFFLMPPSYFDEKAALKNDLPYYFHHAFYGLGQTDNHVITSKVINPPKPSDDHTHLEAGRYLHCPTGCKAVFEMIGLDSPTRIPLSHSTLLKVNDWNHALTPELVHTKTAELINKHFQIKAGIKGPDYSYVVYLRTRPNLDLPILLTGTTSVADNEIHCHTPNLQSALSQLLVDNFGEFDRNLVKSRDLDHHIMEYRLYDPKGKELISYLLAKENGPFDIHGVYLGIDKTLLADPHFATLEPILVAASKTKEAQTLGDQTFIQVARYDHLGQLQGLPIFKRLFVSNTMRHICQEAERRPQILKPVPPGIREKDLYVVQVEWEPIGREYKDGPPRFDFMQGYATPERAMHAIARLPDALYDLQSQLKADSTFRIVEVSLLDIRFTPILIKSPEQDCKGMYHEIFPDMMTERILAAYHQFLGKPNTTDNNKRQDLPPPGESSAKAMHRPRIQREDTGKKPGKRHG